MERSFKTSKSAAFIEILKNSGMIGDDRTIDWFDTSTGASGSAKVMFKMGTMYYAGYGVHFDYGETLKWYLVASEAGIAVAMLKISQMYQYGCGVDQDGSEATTCYHRREEALHEQGRL